MNNWNAQKYRLMYEDGRLICEICFSRPAVDAHHALFGRADGKHTKWRQLWVNDERNIQMVCKECHNDTEDNRKLFWKQAVSRYGIESMIEWLESMPPKMKLPGSRWEEVMSYDE